MAFDSSVCRVTDCATCEGTCWVWDDSACNDPEHCYQVYMCPDCMGSGEVKGWPDNDKDR